MKNYKETDQIIRDKLGQYDSGAPMHLFDGIEEGLVDAPQQKKRGAGWWWTFGLLLLMLVGTSWYMISSSPTEQANVASSKNSTQTLPEAKPQIQQEATQVTTNILATNTIEKENLTQGLTSKKASVIKTQKTIAETQKVIAETITPVSYTHLTLPTKA